MVLVDTSIWIDHLHDPDRELVELLNSLSAAAHPMIIGELAMGSLPRRDAFISLLSNLPRVTSAEHHEVMGFVTRQKLFGLGLGLVDANLLASVVITPGARLWTRDKRLRRVARALGVDDPRN